MWSARPSGWVWASCSRSGLRGLFARARARPAGRAARPDRRRPCCGAYAVGRAGDPGRGVRAGAPGVAGPAGRRAARRRAHLDALAAARTATGCAALVLGAGARASRACAPPGTRPRRWSALGGAGWCSSAAVVLSPSVSRPVIGVLAAPVRRSGATGRIAVDNARRNPRRTASHRVGADDRAGAGQRHRRAGRVHDGVDRRGHRQRPARRLHRLQPDVPAAVAAGGAAPSPARDGVGAVSAVQALRCERRRLDDRADRRRPGDHHADAVDLDVVSGSITGLGPDGLLVDDTTATERGLPRSAARCRSRSRRGTQATLTVAGRVPAPAARSPAGSFATSTARAGRCARPRRAGLRAGRARRGRRRDPGAVRPGDGRRSRTSRCRTRPSSRQSIRDQVNQLLYLVYALLGAGRGHRRARHRQHAGAVGRRADPGDRPAARARAWAGASCARTVRLESVSISVYGALLGLLIGLAVRRRAAALARRPGHHRARASRGSSSRSCCCASVVVGVLAAVWPARRAARLDVLAAIPTE